MTVQPSARIVAAIDLLAPRAGEHLLEIGCGPGHAVAEILRREPTARVDAIDRSQIAVDRARDVNGREIASEQATVSLGDIERGVPSGGIFDRVFSVRVNSFWTKPGLGLPHVAACLKPSGSLWMIYDAHEAKIAEPALASLEAGGWRNVQNVQGKGAWAIVAEPPPRSTA